MKRTNELAACSPNAPQEWQPLLELAVREVFEIMVGCKIEGCTEPQSSPGDLTAMVGLAGQLCGMVTLRCSPKSAASLASRLLATDVLPGDKRMFDAVGEIANMVAGNFKNKLTGIADKCMLSVPTVISGYDYSYRSTADSDPLQMTVIFEGDPVTIKVEIHS
jgi:chemotaxis protein CheX